MILSPLSRCLLCDAASPSGLLCIPCSTDMPVNDSACWQCALPLPQPGLCPDCLRQPPAFDHTTAPFVYRSPFVQLINRWKHHADLRPFPLMAQALHNALLLHYQQDDWPHALVPVPIHRERLIRRGFHQTHQLARFLAHQLGLPVQAQRLSKSVSGHSQQGLDRAMRLKNLAGSFLCHGDARNMHLALVDDVMTTGATANLLASLLRQKGAVRVDIWVLARTP